MNDDMRDWREEGLEGEGGGGGGDGERKGDWGRIILSRCGFNLCLPHTCLNTRWRRWWREGGGINGNKLRKRERWL